MKVAINRCFGGFGLSGAGAAHYLKLKTEAGDPETEKYLDFSPYGDGRTDPFLIETIESLGKEANGDYASLSIVEIPDDVEFTIEEYDGVESIHEVHRSWHDLRSWPLVY